MADSNQYQKEIEALGVVLGAIRGPRRTGPAVCTSDRSQSPWPYSAPQPSVSSCIEGGGRRRHQTCLLQRLPGLPVRHPRIQKWTRNTLLMTNGPRLMLNASFAWTSLGTPSRSMSLQDG